MTARAISEIRRLVDELIEQPLDTGTVEELRGVAGLIRDVVHRWQSSEEEIRSLLQVAVDYAPLLEECGIEDAERWKLATMGPLDGLRLAKLSEARQEFTTLLARLQEALRQPATIEQARRVVELHSEAVAAAAKLTGLLDAVSAPTPRAEGAELPEEGDSGGERVSSPGEPTEVALLGLSMPDETAGDVEGIPCDQSSTCFWRALEGGEWAWAWWFARALGHSVNHGTSEVLPDWLVRAAWAAQYCRRQGGKAAWTQEARKELRCLFGEHPMPYEDAHERLGCGDEPVACMVTAAALVPALLGGLGAEAGSWLTDALSHSRFWMEAERFGSLLEDTRNVLSRLGSRTLEEVARGDMTGASPESSRRDARQWRERATLQRPQYPSAAMTLQYLVEDPQNPLSRTLGLLESGSARPGQLAGELAQLEDQRRAEDLVQTAFKRWRRDCKSPTTRGIAGPALRWILREIHELTCLGQAHLEELQRTCAAKRGCQHDPQVDSVLRRWRGMYPVILDELGQRSDSPPAARIARRVLLRAAAVVVDAVADEPEAAEEAWIGPGWSLSEAESMVLWHVPKAWTMDLELDLGKAPRTFWLALPGQLTSAYVSRASVDETLRTHLEDGHLALARDMIIRCEEFARDGRSLVDEGRLGRLATDLDERQRAEMGKFAFLRRRLTEQLGDALVRGWLSSDEHQVLLARVELLPPETGYGPGGETSLVDVQTAKTTVAEIEATIREHKGKAVAQFEARAADIARDLSSHRDPSTDMARAWTDEARRRAKNGDLELARAALRQAEAAARGQSGRPPADRETELERWQGREEPLSKFMSGRGRPLRNAVEGRAKSPLQLSALPAPRVEEVRAMGMALEQLRGVARRSRSDERERLALQPLRAVFGGYLGFEIHEVSVERDLIRRDHAAFALRTDPVSDRGAIPVPQFGSQASGTYRVIVVWERPKIDSLKRLEGLKRADCAVFVLHPWQLSPRERQLWAEQAVRDPERTSFLLVDELLLAHLADQPLTRMRGLFECALPYTTINPYKATGLVPPEMLFGRDEAVKALSDMSGRCVVDGGRQLGKSTVLREVERLVHRPQDHQYALYEDISNLGLERGAEPIQDLWRRIRDRLVAEGIARGDLGPDAESVAQHLENEFPPGGEGRLLLLLDEADRLQSVDAAQTFATIDRLKGVMDRTQYRFKVVLAGLHGVRRFCSIANHPFAHMGPPVEIGPLAADEAQQLIDAPLTALGYRMDPGAALKLRGYTNDHPGLIQHFCSELIETVRRRGQSQRPPFGITVRDVEDVYRNPKTRTEIAARFQWTVGLDERYEVLVYSFACNRLWEGRPLAEGLDAQEALELAAYWWGPGFSGLTPRDITVMLGELEGLGVLRKTRDGRWAIRNPQVVQFLGGLPRIQDRLEEIGAKPLTSPPEPGPG